jgi:hypothetical protein
MTESELRPYKVCPFCGERVFARGLYLHVLNTPDEAHGGEDEVPEGFSASDVESVGKAAKDVADESDDHAGLNVMCKFCGEVYPDKEELGKHLSLMKRVDDPVHPEKATPDTAGLSVPENTSPVRRSSRFQISADNPMAQFRRERAAEQTPDELKFVPLEEILELRDWAREREGKSGAYVKVAGKLDDLVEKYG